MMKSNRFRNRRLAGWVAITLLFCTAWFSQIYADNSSVNKSWQGDLLSSIRHMEALLSRSCNKVKGLMGDLISHGTQYQSLEQQRTATFLKARQEYIKQISDFIVVADQQGRMPPGKFMQEFMKLKQRAADAGILADGTKPDGITPIGLAHSKDAGKYFYFKTPGSADAINARDLRHKLEGEYEDLAKRWIKARDEFYREFEDKGVFKTYNNLIDKLGRDIAAQEKDYREKKAELRNLALSGDYVHCLGKIEAMRYGTIAVGSGNSINYLYRTGLHGTPDELPGMGFNLVIPARYPVFEKPDIGDFPLALDLKLNGSDYLKLEKELLEIKIEAEEEETRILAGHWALLGKWGAKYGAFTFNVTYKVTESLAAPVQLAQQVTTHPVDSVKSVYDCVVGIPDMLKTVTIEELNLKLNDLTWGNVERVGLASIETLKDIADPGRFDARPGETLEESIERLKGKLESIKQVKAGTEVVEDVTAIIIEYLIDQGITKGLGAYDDFVKGLKAQSKADDVLKRIGLLSKEQKLTGIADDVIDALDTNKKAIKELAEEQLKLNKKLQDFVGGPDATRIPGKPLPADKLQKPLKFKDQTGNAFEIPVGDKLGKGGSSNVYINGADDELVVRVTPVSTKEGRKAAALDKYGKSVLDNEVDSPFIRAVKQDKSMDVLDSAGKKVHIEYNEKITPAKDIIKKEGSISKGQKIALEQAHRDLNSKGYVWVDNHAGNYGFEKLPGEDRWRVVVIDTGGVYPMKGKDLVEKAANARNLQLAMEDVEIKMRAINCQNEQMYAYAVRGQVYNVGSDPITGIDIEKVGLEKVGLKEAGDIPIAGGPGIRPDTGLAEKTSAEVAQITDKHTTDAITNSTAYKELRSRYDDGMKKLDDAIKKVEPQIDAATKEAAKAPKTPSAPGKPGGIDPAVAAKMTLITQELSDAVNDETCAAYRNALLQGVADQKIKELLEKCNKLGTEK